MSQKYLGFPLSKELENRVQDVLLDLKNNHDRRQFALKLFQVISDLSDEGLDYYFIQSLKKAGLSKIKMIAVENAIKVGKKAILGVGKSIIKAMNDEQLLVIGSVLEDSLTIRSEEA
ncbi:MULTISPECIES: hypothetical protein [unclassified Aureispira]|uniref:hypothetical protein n=1 Tax=unclassified Aureispira TaxID=2649989 RepID=UPI00069701EA|nr:MULTISPECIES: hypothetical protein [unclassified Aureispira]WMX12629.1 hypothetical protein QP953_17500 [Aureispira sp. CCB-E]